MKRLAWLFSVLLVMVLAVTVTTEAQGLSVGADGEYDDTPLPELTPPDATGWDLVGAFYDEGENAIDFDGSSGAAATSFLGTGGPIQLEILYYFAFPGDILVVLSDEGPVNQTDIIDKNDAPFGQNVWHTIVLDMETEPGVHYNLRFDPDGAAVWKIRDIENPGVAPEWPVDEVAECYIETFDSSDVDWQDFTWFDDVGHDGLGAIRLSTDSSGSSVPLPCDTSRISFWVRDEHEGVNLPSTWEIKVVSTTVYELWFPGTENWSYHVIDLGTTYPANAVLSFVRTGGLNAKIVIDDVQFGLLPPTPTPSPTPTTGPSPTPTPTGTPGPSPTPTMTPTPLPPVDDVPGQCPPGGSNCIPLPPGGAGNICYRCDAPRSASPRLVSYWIAFLICVLRNLFSCSLRVWLYEIANSANALVAGMLNGMNWFNVHAQALLDWVAGLFSILMQFIMVAYVNFANYLSSVSQSVTVIVVTTVQTGETGIDWLSVVWAIIQFLFSLFIYFIITLYTGALQFLNLVIEVIQGIRLAVHAPPFELDLVMGDIEPSVPNGTPSPEAALQVLIWGLMIGDSALTDYGLWPFIFTVGGIFGIITLIWVVKQWHDILPV